MPSLTNWKNYVIIALLTCLCVMFIRLQVIQRERDSAAHRAATLQIAIDTAQQASKLQSDKQRLKEQEAAKRAQQSQKHMDKIMRQKVPTDCRKAVEWMIQQSLYSDSVLNSKS